MGNAICGAVVGSEINFEQQKGNINGEICKLKNIILGTKIKFANFVQLHCTRKDSEEVE